MSQLFVSDGQSIGASVSASILPMNIQDWFPLGLTNLTLLLSKGLSRVVSNIRVQKHQFFGVQPSLWSSSHIHTYGKTIALTIRIYVGEVMSLFFNMLSKFVRAFLPRSKCLLISWLQSPSAVILEPNKIKLKQTKTKTKTMACGSITSWQIDGKQWKQWETLFLGAPKSLWEKAMAPLSSTVARKIPRMEEPGRLQSMGSLRVRHDWVTSLWLSTFMHWRRKWQPTPVFLPGEAHGRRSLVGCSPWGRTESDTTEAT